MLSTSCVLSLGNSSLSATQMVRSPPPVAASSSSSISTGMSMAKPVLLSVTWIVPSSLTSTPAFTAGVSANAKSRCNSAAARSLWNVSGYWSASDPVLTESMPATCSGESVTAFDRYRRVMGAARYRAAEDARVWASLVLTFAATSLVGTGPA